MDLPNGRSTKVVDLPEREICKAGRSTRREICKTEGAVVSGWAMLSAVDAAIIRDQAASKKRRRVRSRYGRD